MVIYQMSLPLTPENIRTGVLEALARPFVTTTNGTPAGFAYNRDTESLIINGRPLVQMGLWRGLAGRRPS